MGEMATEHMTGPQTSGGRGRLTSVRGNRCLHMQGQDHFLLGMLLRVASYIPSVREWHAVTPTSLQFAAQNI